MHFNLTVLPTESCSPGFTWVLMDYQAYKQIHMEVIQQPPLPALCSSGRPPSHNEIMKTTCLLSQNKGHLTPITSETSGSVDCQGEKLQMYLSQSPWIYLIITFRLTKEKAQSEVTDDAKETFIAPSNGFDNVLLSQANWTCRDHSFTQLIWEGCSSYDHLSALESFCAVSPAGDSMVCTSLLPFYENYFNNSHSS